MDNLFVEDNKTLGRHSLDIVKSIWVVEITAEHNRQNDLKILQHQNNGGTNWFPKELLRSILHKYHSSFITLLLYILCSRKFPRKFTFLTDLRLKNKFLRHNYTKTKQLGYHEKHIAGRTIFAIKRLAKGISRTRRAKNSCVSKHVRLCVAFWRLSKWRRGEKHVDTNYIRPSNAFNFFRLQFSNANFKCSTPKSNVLLDLPLVIASTHLKLENFLKSLEYEQQ